MVHTEKALFPGDHRTSHSFYSLLVIFEFYASGVSNIDGAYCCHGDQRSLHRSRAVLCA